MNILHNYGNNQSNKYCKIYSVCTFNKRDAQVREIDKEKNIFH